MAKHMGRHIIELRLRANAVEDTDNANEVPAAFIAEASRRFGSAPGADPPINSFRPSVNVRLAFINASCREADLVGPGIVPLHLNHKMAAAKLKHKLSAAAILCFKSHG